MKKVIILFQLFIFVSSYSQEKKSLFGGNALWLKNNQSKGELNSHSYISKDDHMNEVKNIAGKGNSLFVVYALADEKISNDSVPIIMIRKGTESLTIDTRKVNIGSKSIMLNSLNPKGNIISIRNLNYRLNKGNLNINYRDYKLYELIYIPYKISEKKSKIINSYLSIKYGISLNKKNNYYDSSYNIIWNASKNKKYSNQIIGIGFDSGTSLYQKESVHVDDDFLKIGFSNLDRIGNNTYFLVGHNNESLDSHYVDEKKIYVLNRVWKSKMSLPKKDKAPTFKFVIKKQLDNKDKSYYMLLSEDDNFLSGDTRIILPAKETDSLIVFDNVQLSFNSFFTFAFKSKITELIDTYDVYPNPVSIGQPVNLHIKLKNPQLIKIIISDLSGKIIYSAEREVKKELFFSFKLSRAGLYFLKVVINEQIKVSKIISY